MKIIAIEKSMRKRADKEKSLSSSFIPHFSMQLQTEGQHRDVPRSPLSIINVIKSKLAFMSQHVLQNQHSLLLLVHLHTLFITSTHQPRETLGATGSQQCRLPVLLMHLVTKQD